ARHAEQMFVALRWQVGRGPLGRLRLLLRRPEVNREVLSAARASPLRQDSPAQWAAGALWWRAWFGPEASAIATAVTALRLAAKECRRAHEVYRELVATGAPAARRRAARDLLWRGRRELILRYGEYEKLPVEQDA